MEILYLLQIHLLYIFHFSGRLALDWISFFNVRYLLDEAPLSGIEQSGLFLKLCKQISSPPSILPFLFVKCISSNLKMYLSKLWNIFVWDWTKWIVSQTVQTNLIPTFNSPFIRFIHNFQYQSLCNKKIKYKILSEGKVKNWNEI